MKKFLRAILRQTPYRIIRAQNANRFQAIEETLLSLKNRGYVPQLVIDGGANVGDFVRVVRGAFGPDIDIHLFEPQPACLPRLHDLLRHDKRLRLHDVALGSSSDQQLDLAIDPSGVNTGAHIVVSGVDRGTIVSVRVETLDHAFASSLNRAQRTLVKLDLQGWELEALKGARQMLSNIEVALIEVSFFAIAREPPIAMLVQFFDEAGFDVHDIASLSGRDRDNRARQADFLFVARWSPLMRDVSWA